MKPTSTIRILDPGAIYGGASLTITQAVEETGLGESEIRSSFSLSGEAEIDAASLQDYILNRHRESVITTPAPSDGLACEELNSLIRSTG